MFIEFQQNAAATNSTEKLKNMLASWAEWPEKRVKQADKSAEGASEMRSLTIPRIWECSRHCCLAGRTEKVTLFNIMTTKYRINP